jgi:hypothetical protein
LRLDDRKIGSTDAVEIVTNRIAKDDRLLAPPPVAAICKVIEFAVATEYWIDVVGVSDDP